MAFRGEWEREVLFTRHLGGQHDQSLHGRRWAARPGGAAAYRAAQRTRKGLDYNNAERRIEDLKIAAAAGIAEKWPVTVGEAAAVARHTAHAPAYAIEDIRNAPPGSKIRRAAPGDFVMAPGVEGGQHMVARHYVVVRPGETDHRPSRLVDMHSPEGQQLCKEACASALIENWAATSNDADKMAHALQEAARREFGLSDAAGWEFKHRMLRGPSKAERQAEAILNQPGGEKALRSFTRTMYDRTQADLAAKGITEVGVFRGYGGSRDPKGMPAVSEVETTMRPMSSWSASPEVAVQFGGVLLAGTAPASQVISTPRTGFGCDSEVEVVLLGGSVALTRVDTRALPYQPSSEKEWAALDTKVESAPARSKVRRWEIPTPDWDTDADWIVQMAARRGAGEQPRRHQGPGPHANGTPQSVHGGGAARKGTLPEGWTIEHRDPSDNMGGFGNVVAFSRDGNIAVAAQGDPGWAAPDFFGDLTGPGADLDLPERSVIEVANEIDALTREFGSPWNGLMVKIGSQDDEFPDVHQQPAGTTWPAASPVRVMLNSRLWTDPAFRHRYSRARGDNLVPTEAPIIRQVITHEYGHVISGPGNHDVAVAMSAIHPGREYQSLPFYARTDPAEAYAEGFTAFRLSSNPPDWAARMGYMEGWDQL